MARESRSREVRGDGALREGAAGDARAHRGRPPPPRSGSRAGPRHARCGCSTSGFFRIGSERYAEENETFGLSTLRRKHVAIESGAAVFDYKAKGALDHNQEIADPLVVPTIKALKDRDDGSHELLAYREGRTGWADVKAAEINEYLKSVTGGDYSAKDFRTWNATVLAAVELATNGHDAETKTARKRAATAATKRVAEYLSNTPAVCRTRLHRPAGLRPLRQRRDDPPLAAAHGRRSEPGEFVDRERIERAVLRLLKD